jgi:hypothetical protein
MPAMFVQNFTVGNQVSNTSIGTSATAASLLTPTAAGNANWPDVMVVNNGSVGVQLALGGASVVAVNTATAPGTAQIYIPAGAVMIVGRNGNNYYSSLADSGTGSLILHLGTGS